MQTAWFTTQDWLDKNKDVARRFAGALVEAGKWAMANPDKTPAILAKYSGFRMTRGEIHFGEKQNAALIQPVYDASARYKFFPHPIAAAVREQLVLGKLRVRERQPHASYEGKRGSLRIERMFDHEAAASA